MDILTYLYCAVSLLPIFLPGVSGYPLNQMLANSLIVQDLTPNIGLYWYFFIEMFDHFRNFFLLVFQAHLACYALPITMKLRCVIREH